MMRNIQLALVVAIACGTGVASGQYGSIGSVPVATTAPVDTKSALKKLGEEKTRGDAVRELERAAFQASRPGADAERGALARELVAGLGGTGVTAVEKVELLRMLEYVGRNESVPAIAALLNDGEATVRDRALAALARNPSKEAEKILLDRLNTARGKERLVFISALGYRGRGGVEEALAPYLADQETVRDAAAALGNIGTNTAAQHLGKALAANKTDGQRRRAVADALLKCADRLAPTDATGARTIYAALETDSSLPRHLGLAAFRGKLLADAPAVAQGRAIDVLSGDDVDRQVIAEEYLRALPGEGADKVLAARYQGMAPAGQAVALRIFMARRSPAARELMIAGAAGKDAGVRSAAIKALGTVGSTQDVPLLAKVAAAEGPDQAAARESLAQLPGDKTNDALIALLTSGEPPVRAEMVKALASRNALDRVATVLSLAEKDSADVVRTEALNALAVLARQPHLEQILVLVLTAKTDPEREAAEAAARAVLTRIPSAEERAAPLLAALPKASGSPRLSIIRLLGRTGTSKALAGIQSAMADADAATHDAAVRALAEWPNPEVLPQLLTMAKSERKDTHKVLATRGYIRLASARSDRTPRDNARLFADILPLTRPDERKQAIAGLGNVPSPEALELAATYFDDKDVGTEALGAATKIARPLAKTMPDAVIPVMKTVVEKTPVNDYTRRSAEGVIRDAEKARATPATAPATSK